MQHVCGAARASIGSFERGQAWPGRVLRGIWSARCRAQWCQQRQRQWERQRQWGRQWQWWRRWQRWQWWWRLWCSAAGTHGSPCGSASRRRWAGDWISPACGAPQLAQGAAAATQARDTLACASTDISTTPRGHSCLCGRGCGPGPYPSSHPCRAAPTLPRAAPSSRAPARAPGTASGVGSPPSRQPGVCA